MSGPDTDILVVGAGIAGGLVAHRLATQGRQVTILEAGPRIDRWATVERFRASVDHNDFVAPYPGTAHAPDAGPDSDYIIEKGDDRYGVQYIRAVGGTTWHWAAATWRFLPVDFRLKSAYGVGRDWPIGYKTLEPYYQEAELALGVAGPDPADEDLGSPRSAPYPQPALPLSYMDREFARILNGNGFHVVTEPVARNVDVYDERPPCCGNNNCMPICPIGAQYSGDVHIHKAEAAGARLIENAVVSRIETDGRRVTGVRYLRPDGSEETMTANTVVLAANGIEIPKLLLMSASESQPSGVANGSDQVGRNLMDHPGVAVSFLWDKPVFPGRGPQEMTSVVNLRDGPFRAQYAAKKLHLGNVADLSGSAEHLIAQGFRQAELDRRLRERVARRVSINSFHEQLPEAHNRIRPSATETDALGLPRPEITFKIGPYVRRSAEETRRSLARIAELLGGTEVMHHADFGSNNHVMGSTIMGEDPRTSVVDADCRSHELPNLHIASSSVFPSSGTVNCTLTIAALALRIADSVGTG